MSRTTRSGSDLIDVRDLTDRLEELEAIEDASERSESEEYEGEFEAIKTLLDDLCGNGGDHDWRGDWYPLTLISDDYFEDYAKELAEDIGAIKEDAAWPTRCIDWQQAASELQGDYSSLEWGGVTYWYR